MSIQLEVFNSKLLGIIDPQQELLSVVSGFEFIEGPIWDTHEQHLTFSDISASKIYRWHAREGLSVLVDGSNKAYGNCFDLEGRILTCEHATSLISRRKANGTKRKVLVAYYQGKELNSPNDIVVKSDGSIYFTDPRFGRNPSNAGEQREQELAFQGVFRYDPNSREITLLADDFENPNGLCFSGDEKKLFVNDSPRSHIRVFDVRENGSLSDGRVWAVTEGNGQGVPDGMKVDINENLYCCAQGGLHFFDSEANYLGILRIPEQTTSFNWGDQDLLSIYLTAGTTVYKVKVKIPGLVHKFKRESTLGRWQKFAPARV